MAIDEKYDVIMVENMNMKSDGEGGINACLADTIASVFDYVYEPGDHILNDDKAAAELLGMKVIDELIKEEIGQFKAIFKEDGIEGIIAD